MSLLHYIEGIEETYQTDENGNPSFWVIAQDIGDGKDVTVVRYPNGVIWTKIAGEGCKCDEELGLTKL